MDKRRKQQMSLLHKIIGLEATCELPKSFWLAIKRHGGDKVGKNYKSLKIERKAEGKIEGKNMSRTQPYVKLLL